MNKQSQKSKLGEIKYRKEILKQHLGESDFFKNEFSQAQYIKMQKEKLAITNKTFKSLAKKYKLSPYLEIGAEYSFRSALLENNFKSKGFATDISLYSLIAAKTMIPKVGYKNIPTRICADANNLPFKSNSFLFIFVYESLHHFPDPKPVLAEIERVLTPGGICLIGADPIRQTLQIRLWRRPNKLRSWEKLLKLTLILPFISHIGKTEIEFGIIEEAFNLKTWQDALSVFDKVEATITPFRLGPKQIINKNTQKNWLSPKPLVKLILFFLGGGLMAICTKSGKQNGVSPKNITDLLICPNCLKSKKLENVLSKENKIYLHCLKCHNKYIKNNSVLVLLDKKLQSALNL